MPHSWGQSETMRKLLNGGRSPNKSRSPSNHRDDKARDDGLPRRIAGDDPRRAQMNHSHFGGNSYYERRREFDDSGFFDRRDRGDDRYRRDDRHYRDDRRDRHYRDERYHRDERRDDRYYRDERRDDRYDRHRDDRRRRDYEVCLQTMRGARALLMPGVRPRAGRRRAPPPARGAARS